MALAQYLSTLPTAHTRDEIIQTWPLYIRRHADRVVIITVGAYGLDAKLLAPLMAMPILRVKVKEDCNQCVQKLQIVVEAYLNEASAPPGTRVVYIPYEWGVLL
jgi:hypothetical protein